MANNKQLMIVVEGTAAMAPYWSTIFSNYLDKIIRFCCRNDITGQTSSSSAASGSTFKLALVMFNAHDCPAFLIQRSGWTRDVNQFSEWLSSLSFSGGASNDVATAEGLAEAFMMFAIPQNGYLAQQNLDGKRHCILVSASEPCPFPTQVYRPAIEIMEQSKINEAQPKNSLYDAKAVSTWFRQCSISLSVICPSQLTDLKGIYNAANPNQRISEPAVDIKLPYHFFVLISDGFSEARAALSRSCLSQRNSSNLIGQPIATRNFAQGTVEMEPGMPQQALGVQSVGLNNSASYIPMSQQGVNMAMLGSQSKCVKFWEGSLYREGQGEFVVVTELEGYRNDKASETLGADWPSMMPMNHLISRDYMNRQPFIEEDFLIFRAMKQHEALLNMEKKKLCAVIHLPNQIMLLSVVDETPLMRAKLFPRDKVVFDPQIPTPVTQQYQEQQLQLQESQQQQQQLQQYQFQQLTPLHQLHSLQQVMQYQLEQQRQEQQQQQQPLQQHHHTQLEQYQSQQLQQHQLHSLQQVMQYLLEQQQQEQQQQQQPLQQHHHTQLEQYQSEQLQQHQLHSLQQVMPYQLEQQQQEQQSQQQQQQPLQQHHHSQLEQYQSEQLQQYQLYSMEQQMMQNQFQHQQLEQQQQISQPQQIVDDGMGHDYMAEKEFIGKSKPL